MEGIAKSLGIAKAASSLEDMRRDLTALGKLFDDVPIKACAVWDTVAAVPSAKLSFVNETIASKIEIAIHALALNEERGPFTPLLWKRPGSIGQTLKQCWFLGTHSGVGGGGKNPELGNITLAWMITQLASVVTFDAAAIYDITTEAISTIPLVRQGDGPCTYGFGFQLPIREFQARTDVHMGWSEYLIRFASRMSRSPFAPGPQSPETFHWSVPTLLKTQVISQCTPYQGLSQDLQNKVERREVFEETLLRAWVVRECHRLIGLLIDINRKRVNPDAIPLYPVLWEPDGWKIAKTEVKQYPWVSTKRYNKYALSLQVDGELVIVYPSKTEKVPSFGISIEMPIPKGRIFERGPINTLMGQVILDVGNEESIGRHHDRT